MKYYLKEEFLHDNNAKNAGNKARNDVEVILNDLGYAPLKIIVDDWYKMNVLNAQIHKYRALLSAFKRLKKNDDIVIQFPLLHHSLFINSLLKSLKNRGVNIFLLIHDLETLRFVNDKTLPFRMKLRMKLTESDTFHSVTGIIAHNPMMKSVLVDKGVAEDKIVSLGIFDYLIPNFQEKTGLTKNQPIIVAGNLAQEKAGYLYSLPAEPAYNLYGVGFDESRALENETYFGSFLPDELPAALEGGFGLVWDGDSAETCSGVFGEYLRYNNSHKASLYLASGFPLVVWKQSALSHFVLEQGCGIAVDSLYDLKATIENLSDDDYHTLVENTKRVGQEIRDGHYLITALNNLK
ncbi:galactofuranosyltransferase [uncultured Streptococcus sp.]|uniref:galactofuranosyltransferase n=1 Tax=uncultured Streptococcus sp. TaxID=83427 RepID=UPI0025F1D437|nr:galactofuranosyltransferase [uncultured Streptococcus sp.]